jgi:sigma-E factor negative regulatory protein RseC
MDMIKEHGFVVELRGGDAMIKFMRTSACGRCQACGMLSTQNEIVVNVPNTLGAEKGDRVSVNIRMRKALSASVIAYAFPLVMLVLGALVGWLLSAVWHVFAGTDVTMALCAIGFAIIAFPIMRLALPLYKRQVTNVYDMTEVVKPDGTHVQS